MSQKKMEEYKKYKQNRKQILEKEKKMKVLKPVLYCAGAVAIIAIVVVIGYFSTLKPEATSQANWMNYSKNFQNVSAAQAAAQDNEAEDTTEDTAEDSTADDSTAD